MVGAKRVRVGQGTFKVGNSSGADALATGDAGNLCYAVDDQTVALPVAATVVQFDADSVGVH